MSLQISVRTDGVVLGFPYIGPVGEVLSGPNARVLDIATVSPSTITAALISRVPECEYRVRLLHRQGLMGRWAIEMADMFPQYVPDC